MSESTGFVFPIMHLGLYAEQTGSSEEALGNFPKLLHTGLTQNDTSDATSGVVVDNAHLAYRSSA